MIAGPADDRASTTAAPASITTRPSTRDSSSTLAVDARLDRVEHEAVAVQQRVLLAGVDPPALEHLVRDRMAVVDQPLDRVGDLELAARRRLRSRARPRGCGGRRGTRRRARGPTADRRASRRGGRRRRRASSSATPNWRGIVDVREQDLRGRERASGSCSSSCRVRSATKRSTNGRRSCWSMLSPRYMTKSSSPRKSRGDSTQCARPSGASWGM